MKKLLLIPFFCICFNFALQAQEDKEEEKAGKVSAKIYGNFNYGLNDANNSTAFEIARAYFGYERAINDFFFAEVKLDIGSPDDISEFSRIYRYTYFKNAYLGFHKNNLTAWFGLMDMLQFKMQEKFWGYRYLYKTFMDEYRFGPSADIGTGVSYSFSKYFTADLVISNGEGYKRPQNDNNYKIGYGMTVSPVDGYTIRTYFTIFTKEIPQMSATVFMGYSRDRFRIGGEFIHQWNYDFYSKHNRYGYSIYSTYAFNEKWEIFARYDQLYSNILNENTIPWNLPNDGSAIIAGFQYAPIRQLNMALNYQDWVEYASNGISEPFIYLNFEINF